MSLFACPVCQHDKTGVVDSRPAYGGITRRRRCESCRTRFTTREFLAGNDGAGNFGHQLDALARKAGDILAQSEALLRDTENLQRLSAAWREIEEGKRPQPTRMEPYDDKL